MAVPLREVAPYTKQLFSVAGCVDRKGPVSGAVQIGLIFPSCFREIGLRQSFGAHIVCMIIVVDTISHDRSCEWVTTFILNP